MALHDDDWPDSNPRSISTFHTFSRGSSVNSASTVVSKSPSLPTKSVVTCPIAVDITANGITATTDGLVTLPLRKFETDDFVTSFDDGDFSDVPLYDRVDDGDVGDYGVSSDFDWDLPPPSPPPIEFKIDLEAQDRRFGFSVVGGHDEGFPPRIDEITPSSPADRTDLEVGDEILEVNGRSLENATHTEVISHIHQCIKSRTICLRVKRKTGNKLALDLAQHNNVQDAFVIAVEQQARERLEKLSALQKIKPVDMTKLSQQLSRESSTSSQDLNGIIEDSPIYVTSVPNLSQSTSNIGAAVEGKGLRPKGHHPVTGSAPDLDSGRRTQHHHHLGVGSNGYVETDGPEPRTVVEEEIELKQHLDVAPVIRRDSTTASESPASTSSKLIVGSGGGRKAEVTNVRGSGSSGSSASTATWDRVMREPELPHREMAVDVPDSFMGSSKAPPRYPPPKTSGGRDKTNSPSSRPQSVHSRENGNLNSSTTSSSSSSRGGGGGGGVNVGLKMAKSSKEGVIGVRVLPALPGGGGGGGGGGGSGPRRGERVQVQETSLTISKVGNGSATGSVPTPAPRTINSPTRKEPPEVLPTESQLDRIRKYQEDIRKRREEEERIQREQDFLRTSLRGSKKLQALEQNSPSSATGFDNNAFQRDDDNLEDDEDDDDDNDDDDEDDNDGNCEERAKRRLDELDRRRSSPAPLKRIAGAGELIASLQRVQAHLRANGRTVDGVGLSQVDDLLRDQEFQQALKIHNKVQQVCCFRTPPNPLCADSQGLTQEVLNSLHESSLPEAAELSELLNRYEVEGLLFAHDKIAEREAVVAMSPDEELLDRASQYREDSVKIVRIEKTNEPLGATVRNEGEAVIIGRIVKGGVAEKSRLLHEGDEVLEVNNIEMRGKSVNDVCDILANMTGTLTFLIVPTQYEHSKPPSRETVMHIKAHFDYDPEEDHYLPCRELGISFRKGEILHIINQEDPNWWQAFREGEEDQSLAGLIPSKSFQQQREALKHTITDDTNNREKSKKGTLLCAKKNAKKKKKKVLYNANYNDEFDAEEILTYEEVTLYYPRANRKRPIVLIGPPNIGRHELRQKLMEDVERFAAAVPHTSRPKKDEELDGQDYYFISRQQFEGDILGRKFVEHGEYEKNYYGTSLDAIRTVVNSGKICVLNLHPQSLKILKASDLKPFVVYVVPPPLEKLRQNRTKMGINAKDDELKEIIEKAREMEESYGHYFDMIIINSDLERAYNELLHEINILEREPQWVPAAWLQNEIN